MRFKAWLHLGASIDIMFFTWYHAEARHPGWDERLMFDGWIIPVHINGNQQYREIREIK